ncbi:MAG TPA: glycoside hydrolase family 38 C-terminal domain-containing protein [Anaerolineales bacterium]
MSMPKSVTIVSHTHWDRAWYVTYQEFRARLVRLIDRLIDLLDSRPDYRVFTLDGQMAVLEDYLEVRPQRQADLARLCQEGRLKIGPWYVLADEFLVSPEALIRNMTLGHRMGAAYGGVSKIGYVPDGFGHIAQLPQILRGFDIDNAFFWRGIGEEGERLGTEFVWKAPDGSKVTTIWMPWGYHIISNLGYPIHWGDTSQMEFDPELAMRQIGSAVERLDGRDNTGALLLMNGIDHEEAEPRIPEMVRMAQERYPQDQFSHGTLEEHLARVRESGISLPEFSGEFRWGKYSEILQGVYSTRIWLKQINHRVETLLERYAEPLAAIAHFSGTPVPAGTQDLLWTAWRWLLKNHPHDDLYGSGIDRVHEEMRYRFDQAEQIGEIIQRDSLRQIARQVDFSGQEGMPVLVYNPSGWPRQEMAVGNLDFDFDDPTANSFRILDADGKVIPHQVLSDKPAFWMETLKANRKRRVRVAFPAGIPAFGYSAFYVQPVRGTPQELAGSADWAIFPDGAENSYLSFHIESDGGLALKDKVSGAVYHGLNHFEDAEDAGDEYTSSPMENGQTFTTRGSTASARQVVSGPNQVTFEVERTLEIPEGLTPDRHRRSEKKVALPILSRLTLYRDQPGLFVETEVLNEARDHKLSAAFPTDLNPAQAFVDESFAVLPRDIDLPPSPGWVEDPTALMHQRAFTDLSEGGRGLAVFNQGLPAVEVLRKPEGAQISLTLLRCVGWLSRDDLPNRRVAGGPLVPTPGAQCLGKYRFEYAIFPHAGDWQAVYAPAYNYLSPLLVARADTHEGLELREMNITGDDPAQVKPISWPRRGPLPEKASFLRLTAPELVLSSVHLSEDGDGLIVRFYNIATTPVTAQVETYLPLTEAWSVKLNEERQHPIGLAGEHSFTISALGRQVVTLELRFRGPGKTI